MTYSVALTGAINPNVDKSDVINKLMTLFKKDQAFIEQLLSGKKVVIKRNLDQETAKKYQNMIMKAGAFTCLVDETESASSMTTAMDQQGSEPAEPETGQHDDSDSHLSDSISVAAAGEIIVQAEKIAEPLIDISSLDLAAAGETILEPQPPAIYQPKSDASLVLSDAGETLVEAPIVKPADIETAHLTMSQPGEQILKSD